jgi:uncharacterized protein YkwD
MRLLVIPLLVAVAGNANAQYPWSYAPYNPGYNPYAPYAPRNSPYVAASPSLARDMLATHNAVRARVGVPPLAWSAQLAALAQDWANALIASQAFSHRPNNRYGENIYAISGGAASAAEAVATWAGEARGYDIRNNSCSGICGHYTQLIWRSTTTVGCGVASDAERQVWVCNYNPPGNVVGYRPY